MRVRDGHEESFRPRYRFDRGRIPAAVLLVLWGAIRPEERYLHERFGAQYDDYRRLVRRWLVTGPAETLG
jgi:hypothetical protein